MQTWVSCKIDGKTHEGNYWVAGKILVVSTAMDGKSTSSALYRLKLWQSSYF